MDKSCIMDVKIEHRSEPPCTIHHLPQGRQSIHRDYGLWIIHASRSCVSMHNQLHQRYFEFYSLSHMYDGSGIYWTPGVRTMEVKAGDGILIAPHFVHYYGAGEKPYIEDAICFCGPVADVLFNHGIISNGIMSIGATRRLLPIAAMAADPATDAQINANITLQRLLLELFYENRQRQSGDRQSRLEELLALIRSTPEKWWTIEEMAEYCNLSTAQFRRIFHQHTGVLPKLYIDRLKTSWAAAALAAGHDPLEQIARRFGYLDPFHFSRRFKQLTGFSPERYRWEFFRSPQNPPSGINAG